MRSVRHLSRGGKSLVKASELPSGDFDHELAEAYLFRIRFEIVAFGGHGFGHRQSRLFADLSMVVEKSPYHSEPPNWAAWGP